jgi:hypothetical protein
MTSLVEAMSGRCMTMTKRAEASIAWDLGRNKADGWVIDSTPPHQLHAPSTTRLPFVPAIDVFRDRLTTYT